MILIHFSNYSSVLTHIITIIAINCGIQQIHIAVIPRKKRHGCKHVINSHVIPPNQVKPKRYGFNASILTIHSLVAVINNHIRCLVVSPKGAHYMPSIVGNDTHSSCGMLSNMINALTLQKIQRRGMEQQISHFFL